MVCVRVESCECRVCYSGQPPQCFIYLEPGYCSPACPLSGLCRRCRQPGHMAKECTQAWALQSLFLPSWIRPLNHLLHLTMLCMADASPVSIVHVPVCSAPGPDPVVPVPVT